MIRPLLDRGLQAIVSQEGGASALALVGATAALAVLGMSRANPFKELPLVWLTEPEATAAHLLAADAKEVTPLTFQHLSHGWRAARLRELGFNEQEAARWASALGQEHAHALEVLADALSERGSPAGEFLASAVHNRPCCLVSIDRGETVIVPLRGDEARFTMTRSQFARKAIESIEPSARTPGMKKALRIMRTHEGLPNWRVSNPYALRGDRIRWESVVVYEDDY